MFFSKVYPSDAVDQILTCPKCNTKYDEPKVLPCAKLVCKRCVNSMINGNKSPQNEFKCDLCNQLHLIPENAEFPTCENFMQILNIKPTLIARDKDREAELETSLCEIDSLITKIDTCGQNLHQYIREHYSKLKQQILTDKETRIQQINEIARDLLEKVNLHENECIEIYTEKTNVGSQLNKSVEEFKSFYQELFIEKSQNESDNLQETLNEFKTMLEQEVKYFQEFLNKRIHYISSKLDAKNILGQLIIEQTNKIDFTQMKKLSLSDYFVNQDGFELSVEEVGFGFFDTNYMIICFTSISKLYLTLLDENKKFSRQKVIKKVKKFEDDLVTVGNKMAIMYLDSRSNNFLEVYDSNLELCHSTKAIEQRLIGATDAYIFTYSTDKFSKPLFLYKWNLEIVNKLGQRESPTNTFYFSPDITKICYSNSHFYCLINTSEKKYIEVMNCSSGECEQEIKTLSAILIEITSDSSIRVINENKLGNLVLSYYSLDGKCLKEIQLVNFPLNDEIYTCSFLVFDKKENIFFFDKNEYYLYHN